MTAVSAVSTPRPTILVVISSNLPLPGRFAVALPAIPGEYSDEEVTGDRASACESSGEAFGGRAVG